MAEGKRGLLELPEDILIEILKRLPSYELMVVCKAFPELNPLRLRNKALWWDVDLSGHAFELHEMPEVLEYLHEQTFSLTLQGRGYTDHWINQPLTPQEVSICNITGPLLTGLSSHCENLKHLTLKKAWLPRFKIKIQHFPSSLTHLSLVRCKMYIEMLDDLHITHPLLEYLKIEEVQNFSGSDFYRVMKNKSIKTMIVRRCQGIFEMYWLGGELPNLEVFELSDSGTIGGYCHLVEFSRLALREITLSCSIRCSNNANLFLNDYPTRDSGLLRKNLEKLILLRSYLSDIALETIGRLCNKLVHVSLVECKGISEVGVTNFENILKEKNSSCEVIHK